MAKTPSS